MITLTDKAIKKALSLAEKQGKPKILRVGVRGGGCSGLSYFLDFVSSVREDDEVLQRNGLTVVCDPKSLRFIADTELDYDTNLLNGGFKFKNPQAKKTCSCGESFSVF